MPGASVGFLVRQLHFPETDDERKELGTGRYGALITESELRELSIVPIPANPAALTRKSIDAIKAVRERVLADMMEKGFGNEMWKREFDELFPCTEDDWRDIEQRCRRRSVSMPKITFTSSDLDFFIHGGTDTTTTDNHVQPWQVTKGGFIATADGIDDDDTHLDAEAIADGLSELAAAVCGVRDTNEQLAAIVDDLRETISELAHPNTSAPAQPTRRNVYDDYEDILTEAVAAANHSNGAKA